MYTGIYGTPNVWTRIAGTDQELYLEGATGPTRVVTRRASPYRLETPTIPEDVTCLVAVDGTIWVRRRYTGDWVRWANGRIICHTGLTAEDLLQHAPLEARRDPRPADEQPRQPDDAG